MEFSLDSDQAAITELARTIFADHCGDDQIRTFAASGQPYDANLWRILAEAGLTGIGIDESLGGTGFGTMETGFVLEQAGVALAPVPLRDTLVAARTLASAGTAHHGLVAEAAAGKAILTSACDEIGAAWDSPALQAHRDGNGWRLSGSKTAVAWGMEASAILVSARIEGEAEAGLFLLPTDTAGLRREAQRGTDDLTPFALLDLQDVHVPGDALLDAGHGHGDLLRWHLGRQRVALCSSQLGIASEALKRTAAYTSERVQFGRPIGSMQAVQQRAADGYIDVEAMRSTTWRAAWLLDQGECNDAEIAAAKYWAAIGGHRVTHSGQHMHGGMGADVTYPIHRFFLAAKAVESALGGAQPMLATLGALIAGGKARPLSAIGGGFDAV